MREQELPPLTPRELASAGQALFGPSWRSELARALRVNEAEIVMVESGQAAAPTTWREILVMLAQDLALRAMDTASSLLWNATRDHAAESEERLMIVPRASPSRMV